MQKMSDECQMVMSSTVRGPFKKNSLCKVSILVKDMHVLFVLFGHK